MRAVSTLSSSEHIGQVLHCTLADGKFQAGKLEVGDVRNFHGSYWQYFGHFLSERAEQTKSRTG